MRTITPANVDDFIAQRHKYLENKGLLGQLESVTPLAPLPTAIINPKPGVPSPNTAKNSAPQEAAAQPATEVKVEAPLTIPPPPTTKTIQTLKYYSEHPSFEGDVTNPPPAKENSLSYQLWAWFSWVGILVLLGWLALPD